LRNEEFVAVSSLGNAFLVVLSASREHQVVTEDDLRRIKERLEANLVQQLEDEVEQKLLATVRLYIGFATLSQSPKVRFKRALLQSIESAVQAIQYERSASHTRLVDELDRVLADEQISCVYQPVVELEDYKVVGYEVLARGPQSSELHAPEMLFEVARDQGRVQELDLLCRLMASRSSSTLPHELLRFVNTEPVSLFMRGRSDLFVEEFVAATPEPLRAKTVIEITEKSVIEDFEQFRDVVARLRAHGFRIAIDDAGAGYSGLRTVVEAEPDFIKLDISLIRGVNDSHVKQKLVKTLRDFASEAGIALIAEGIETEAQLAALRELEIPYGQGFLFGYPGSPYPLQERIEPGHGVRVQVGKPPAESAGG
jgi:EAL domain-containing protein (putative c-di-GMP-specific phosphodiesterase class I)